VAEKHGSIARPICRKLPRNDLGGQAMMVDKADTESEWRGCRGRSVAAYQASDGAVLELEATGRSSRLNLFEEHGALNSKAFALCPGLVCGPASAAAPYFVHIVRANRAQQMIGQWSGVNQAGQPEKQTVAGR
jgi:hypothetical protein